MAHTSIGAILTLAVLALAGFLLFRTLSGYDLAGVLAALTRLDGDRLTVAALFTAASYGMLTVVDLLAVRYSGRTLPYRHVALASFTALSIGHSLGFAALSSGAVRFRFYRRWGLTVGEIARVIMFCGLTVLLGYTALGGLTVAGSTGWLSELLSVPRTALAAVGGLALGVPIIYCAAVVLARPVRIRHIRLLPPKPALAAGQLLLGCLDVALVAAVLHQTLGGSDALPFATVLAVYIAAAVAGMLAHAPGGLGVLEAVTLALLPGAETIAGLLAFRAIYYLAPLAIGGAMLAIFELTVGRRRAGP